jgi:hypothetical protein
VAETSQKGSFVLTEVEPVLLYAIIRKPSDAQWKMCNFAVELHNRISDIPARQAGSSPTGIDGDRRTDLYRTIVRAFAAGGVGDEVYPQNSLRQLDDLQKKVFAEFFSPRLNRAKRHFIVSFLALAVVVEAMAWGSSLSWSRPVLANYLHLSAAAALGTTIFSAGRGLHHEFAEFDNDMQALSNPLVTMFLAVGVALILAFLLSTEIVKVEIGGFKPATAGTSLPNALALGAIVGFARADAFKFLIKVAGQAVGSFRLTRERRG